MLMTQRNHREKIPGECTGPRKQQGRNHEAETSPWWSNKKAATLAAWERGERDGGDGCGTRVRCNIEVGTPKLSD